MRVCINATFDFVKSATKHELNLPFQLPIKSS